MLNLTHEDVAQIIADDPWPFEDDWLQWTGPQATTGTPVPKDIDWIEPGPMLGWLLATIDIDRCSGPDRVRVLQARQRLASHYQAQVYGDIAAVSDHFEEADEGDLELAAMGTVAEIRAALRLTRRAADSEVAFAIELKRRLPTVWESLAKGHIDVRRARTIVYGTSHLTEDDARGVVDRIMPHAGDLTTGQLSARIRKLCVDVNPEDAADRYCTSIEERRLIVEVTVDGSAEVCILDAPADRAAAASDYVNRCARQLKTPEETRSLDQLRADVALDLLSGHNEPGTVRGGGSVNLTVELATLAELNESSAEVAGYGPVIADVARKVARRQGDSPWRFVVTHQGDVVATGATRRRPNTRQRRHVEAHNPTCVFPGCRMPSVECDLDHRHDWAGGGPTTTDNLAPLCRHDHLNKHRLGWTYRRLPDGRHEWTSKLGQTYLTERPP